MTFWGWRCERFWMCDLSWDDLLGLMVRKIWMCDLSWDDLLELVVWKILNVICPETTFWGWWMCSKFRNGLTLLCALISANCQQARRLLQAPRICTVEAVSVWLLPPCADSDRPQVSFHTMNSGTDKITTEPIDEKANFLRGRIF